MGTEQLILGFLARFPGQEVGGDSKIPSVVCYGNGGNVVAVGSEADEEINPELREVEGLVRAEWCAWTKGSMSGVSPNTVI